MKEYEVKGCVYKITSPKGYIYIGKTVNWKKRLVKYKNYLVKQQTLIYNSLIKHGFNNHKIEILFESKDDEELKRVEIFYISEFKTNRSRFPENKGLNLTDGGDGSVGYKASKKVRETISKAQKGKKLGAEARKNISEAKKGSKNPNYGKKMHEEQKVRMIAKLKLRELKPFTEEHKRRISESKKGKRMSMEQRIRQSQDSIGRGGRLVLNFETGVYYESTRMASDSTVYSRQFLGDMLRGVHKNKTSFKYV